MVPPCRPRARPGNLVGLLALLVSVAGLQLGFPRGAGLALGFGGVALLASDHRWPSVAAGLPFAFTDAELPRNGEVMEVGAPP
ncbi:MAG: hypothetical protein JWN54_3068 [Mycobacterium sp.]|nr:hypothetical protein [Mycobacterium sp.]